MNRTLLPIFVVAACGKVDAPAPPAPSRLPALEHATQDDLARELAEADRLGTWSQLTARWQGQALRWTVTRQRALCSAASVCNVAAFPIARPARQGWMPALAFAPGQYDVLAATCGDREPCELIIEGTLRELEASPELPTRVQLANVRVATAVAAHVQPAQE